MTNCLYRFRASVLGKHEELENQEIFCSSLETLNDPMEGFKDLFWSGDRIIWTNLLKHYLLCLDRACIQFMLSGDGARIELASIPVFEIESDLPTQEYKDVFKQSCATFFGAPGIMEFVDALASRTQPVRRDELCLYLRMVHYTALNAILSAYRDRGGISDTPGGSEFINLCATLPVKPEIPKLINELEARYPHVPGGAERLFAVIRNAQQQNDLLAKYGVPVSPLSYNRHLLLNEFAGEYLRVMERMVYGQWYTACFSASYVNSSMWGNYANGHRGVCLKFNTGEGDNHVLSLFGVTGFRSSRLGKSEPTYGQVKHHLRKVTYQSGYPEIDFFRSLGRLRGIAVSWWYSDGNGNRSVCAKDLHDDEVKWRERYWDKFLEGQTVKLEDWKYEEEYRLVTSELISDLSDPMKRKHKYNFSDLQGIIFGIATPEADKLAIIDITRRKCDKESRKQFEFSQAYYAKATGTINALPLNLIRA